MLKSKNGLITLLACCGLFGFSFGQSTHAEAKSQRQTPPQIELVIALDVSSSMSGLIDSAKQRLWDIVNELGRAQPQPQLRLAILTYGNPGYGAESGYVRIDLPFTRDLDAVNETLFSFGTDGGDEYVARVIDKSVNELDWSTNSNTLRIIFVAGNEGADQDPQVSLQQATLSASNKGIVVNTIYCGQDGDTIAAGWRNVANMTNGLYASIDQNSSAVANIATPMDNELTKLNAALNDTYVSYGKEGRLRKQNQLKQDGNARAMSSSAAASRVVAKAGSLYDASGWDLVDAIESGTELANIAEENLPAKMQEMDEGERESYIEDQAEKREKLRSTINELDKDRRNYIAKEKAKQAASEPDGLDDVIQKGLRSLAEKKGFTFAKE